MRLCIKPDNSSASTPLEFESFSLVNAESRDQILMGHKGVDHN